LITEGAEPVVEPLTNWIDYILWVKIKFIGERAFRGRFKTAILLLLIRQLKVTIRLSYCFFRFIYGNIPDRLSRQGRLARYAAPYYNTKLLGGEGHMEAGKHISAIRGRRAHMVISIKPFSCMPSTQSDGVQTKISDDLKNSLFVSIDTTGDAEINVKSRILMKLHEAQKKAREEFEDALRRYRIDNAKMQKLRSNAHQTSFPRRQTSRRYISTAASMLRILAH
jgi:predicted nucleotide-binding protein (sugar kinase/HSP70/actin superfamily)